MTDYDRGAYTPQTDAPLAFDPRRPSERRPMPMALIGSAVVLVILLAGVAMVYRGGVRHAGESPRPVGEPVMAVKTAPTAAQTAAATPPANLDVYSAGQSNTVSGASANQTGDAPAFAPSAEQPAARPAPSAATVAMLSKPSAPTHIERPSTPVEAAAKPTQPTQPAHVKLAKAATATVKTTAAAKTTTQTHAVSRAKLDESELAAAGATRTVADADTPPSDADAPMTHKAKPAETSAAPTAASGKAVVQIGAFSSTTLADKGYADVSATLPERMSGKAKHVQPLDKDGSTLYRTWLSGFASRADAQAFCEALKAKGKTCLVKG